MSLRKILFVDRDGTLVEEPPDEQVDRLDKIRLLPGVIAALQRFVAAGYELVMVSNQDGAGTEAFPEEDFRKPQQFILDLLASQGIEFSAVHIDRSFPEDRSPNRKPNVGMVLEYLRGGNLDFQRSAVVGDRDTDLELAENMGVRGLRVGPAGLNWSDIAASMLDAPRTATVERNTNETQITVVVNLDDTGADIATGIGFFDHMLEQLSRHGDFALALTCRGDLHVDEHHTVEDCALALGAALNEALGDKRGIGRYGFVLPMDEAQARVAVDLGGRPWFRMEQPLPRTQVGGLSTEMVEHFFASLSQAMEAAIHIDVSGSNVHHLVEAMFKGVARSLRQAFAREGTTLPTTKGLL